MKSLQFNIFLIHRYSEAILLERFDTDINSLKDFLKFVNYFKKLAIGNNIVELKDFYITYVGTSSLGLFNLLVFYKLSFKRFQFPFYFKIITTVSGNSFSKLNIFKCKILQFLLNLYLVF